MEEFFFTFEIFFIKNTQKSKGKAEDYFSQNEVLRYLSMVPGIIRIALIVPFQPIVSFRYLDSRTVRHSSSLHFDDSFADTSFWTDRLNSYDNITLLRFSQKPIAELINQDDILRKDGRFHGDSFGVADRKEILIDGIVGRNDGKESNYLF